MQIVCRFCGKEIKEDYQICPYCRKKLITNQIRPATMFLYGILSVLVTIGVIFILSKSFRNDILSFIKGETTEPFATFSTALMTTGDVDVTSPSTPTATLKPKLTHTPNDKPEDYSIYSTLLYDEFIDNVNKYITEDQNKLSAKQFIYPINYNTSINTREFLELSSFRHQINDNLTISTWVIGRKPYIDHVILIGNWNGDFDNDASISVATLATLYAIPDGKEFMYEDKYFNFVFDCLKPSEKKLETKINDTTIIINSTEDKLKLEIYLGEK